MPSTSGKIGEGDGLTAVFDGNAREFADGAPFGEVINVDVERKTAIQALDEAAVHSQAHQVVGCAVAALNRLPRADHVVAARVFVGIDDIVLQENRFSVSRAHQCGGVVAVAEIVALKRIRVHTDKRFEAVGAVDVEQLAGRTHSVRGVEVAAQLPVRLDAPRRPSVANRVDVGTLDVNNRAEIALFDGFHHGKVATIVAAVFEHRAVALRALGGIDQRPTIGQRHRGRNLDGDVLPAIHRLERNRHVRRPVGTDINEVEVVAAAKVLVVGEGCWVMGDFLHHRLQALFRKIAEGGNFGVFNLQESLHGLLTALAESDDADAHKR